MTKREKDLHRKYINIAIMAMVIGLAIATVVLTYFDKLSPEFNFAVGALLAYAGNHTYQNFRTTPDSSSGAGSTQKKYEHFEG